MENINIADLIKNGIGVVDPAKEKSPARELTGQGNGDIRTFDKDTDNSKDTQDQSNKSSTETNVDDRTLFYSLNDKGKPYIEPEQLIDFMSKQGFMRESGTENLIKNDNKVLKYFPKEEIPSFLKSFVPYDNFRNILLICIAHTWKTQIQDYMLLMDATDVKYHRDTADAVYIPFRNGVAKITADGVTMMDYADNEIGFFPELESMHHDFSIGGTKGEGVFERFVRYAITGTDDPLEDLSDKQKSDFRAFCSAIGYLISSFKRQSKAYCLIFADEGSDNIANAGGRGKTLIVEAISKVRSRLYKGKGDWRKDDRFALSGLQKHHTLIVHDDVPAGYDWHQNYTLITNDMEVQPKYINPFVLPFAESPKIVVTTNNSVRYDEEATSTTRRYREYKFTKFWNNERKPSTYFGGDFFSEWTEQDWQQMFDFFIRCAQIFIKNGLIEIKYDKTYDNYVAMFNDVREQEYMRIFNIIDAANENEFNVSRFREIHLQRYPYKDGADFNLTPVKARDSINYFIKYHRLPWEYDKKFKVWRKFKVDNDNDDDDVIETDLPF